MGAKVAVVALVAIAAFLVFRPTGSRADKVANCLETSGATVTQTRLVQGGEGLPREIKRRLLEVEKRNYVVQLGDDSGLLILVRSNGNADEVSLSLEDAEGPENVQRTGEFVMYWRTVPTDYSAGILARCLS